MKIFVVDNIKTLSKTEIYYLEGILSYEVIGVAKDRVEFLKKKDWYYADIIILNLDLPNLNGIEIVKRALWIRSDLKFIAVTSFPEKTCLLDLIGAGFKACILKNRVYDDLENVIKTVQENRLYFPQEIIMEKS